MQTRRASLLESLVNTASGYLLSLASQIVLFPLFGIHVSIRTNLLIGAWFTLLSIARGYVLRRVFTRRTEA